jgi:hypothetical protein
MLATNREPHNSPRSLRPADYCLLPHKKSCVQRVLRPASVVVVLYHHTQETARDLWMCSSLVIKLAVKDLVVNTITLS